MAPLAENTRPGCELCSQPGGTLVASGPSWRVIRAVDPDFPAFYRVVWTEHVAEFSDLGPADRSLCMDIVTRVEEVLRRVLQPTKVNLATLGNVVPHLHWHVVARFDWDSHFPQTIWGARQREVGGGALARLGVSLNDLDDAVRQRLSTLPL